MPMDCTFCQIVNGQTETPFLHEDDRLVVFKDINPHAPVHLLIVPKKHIRSINDLTDEDRDILADIEVDWRYKSQISANRDFPLEDMSSWPPLVDPWGIWFAYQWQPEGGDVFPLLQSAGPDRLLGTADDILNR